MKPALIRIEYAETSGACSDPECCSVRWEEWVVRYIPGDNPADWFYIGYGPTIKDAVASARKYGKHDYDD